MNNTFQQRLEALGQMVAGDSQDGEEKEFWSKSFNLFGNPFPPSGIADASEENPPLQDAVTGKIIDFIDSSYRSKNTQSLILSGDYGTGKTHTLRFIEHAVNTIMGSGDHGARAIYVERPRIEAHELNRTILRSLGHDTVRKYIWFALKKQVIEEIEQDSVLFQDLKSRLTTSQVSTKKGVTSAPLLFSEGDAPVMTASFDRIFDVSKLADHRSFLYDFESKKWSRDVLKPFFTACLMKVAGDKVASELAGSFVALLLSRDETSFASWENLTGLVKSKSLAFSRPAEFMDFLITILKINGVSYLYLLLDEFEEVPQGFHLTPRQRQDYLYTMREVFDRIRDGIAIIMAITPAALAALTELAPPFADRNPIRIDLSFISVDDSVRLVDYFLTRERTIEIGEDTLEDERLMPLSRELIEHIVNNFPVGVQRTPRSLIQFLYKLFDHAYQKKVSFIDESVLDEVLAQFGTAKLLVKTKESPRPLVR